MENDSQDLKPHLDAVEKEHEESLSNQETHLSTLLNNENAFKSIVKFVDALNTEFGKKNKSLQLYNHLLEKTQVTNSVPVSKHILAFKSFINVNKDHLLSKNFSEINGTIFYSDKVFINMTKIVKMSDELDLKTISKHLYNIWSHIEPESEAQNILKSLTVEKDDNSNEDNFIENIMTKVESAVGNKKLDENSNPMEAMQTLMQSGIFNDIFQGMTSGVKSGKLDINKMLGTVQNLVKKISPEDGDNQLNNMMGMLGPMMSGMMGQKK